MADTGFPVTELLAALHFAAQKHSTQRRKDAAESPYINHPIAVAELLARVGRVCDLAVLQAAILHDTVEDTETSPEEVEQRFGAEVRGIVMEVTDDKSLPKAERKQKQIEHAPHLSVNAQQVKLADKICNVGELDATNPLGWPIERKREYLEWAVRVVAGLRGCNPHLEQEFDRVIARRREVLGMSP